MFKKLYRSFVLVALFLCAGLLLSTSHPEPGLAQTSQRPNIVFILTDDLDADPASISHMPNLQSLLIDEGTTFENTFVTDSICCPSRTTILRGQYTHNHQVWENEPPNGGFERFRDLGLENSTIATWLQQDGYRTVHIGKYLNRTDKYPAYVHPGWDEWYGWAGANRLDENGTVVSYDPSQYYQTDVLASKATDFIRRSEGDDTPFFMQLAPRAPHQPATPAPRHQDLFADATAPRPPSFDEQDVSDKPAYIRDRAPLSASNISYIDKLYRNRLRSMMAVDDMIGNLVDTLRETGKLDNTYIVFTSDNGLHMGQHRLVVGKWTPYEEDIRVPLIIRGPGVPAGRTLPHFVLNNDFAPAFADLAGVPTPDFVDGRSLVPLLTSNPPDLTNWRSAFLVEGAAAVWNGRPSFMAVRTKDYMYARYSTGETELYYLNQDPYELENQSAVADPELIARLRKQLEALRSCAGAECRAVEEGNLPQLPDDAVPPTTSATLSPVPNGAGWNNTDVTVSLDATDNDGGSGVRELSYSATGANSIHETFARGSSTSINVTTQGETTVTYFATDRTGNAEEKKSISVRLDKTAPGTVITSGPGSQTNDKTPTFSFGGTDNLTPNADLLYSYKVDDGEWSEYSNQTSATLGGEAGLSEGLHTLRVKARDLAGNEDATPVEKSFRINPDTTITSGPKWMSRNTTASFTFTSTVEGSTFECSLDGADFSACSSPIDYADLASGEHTFSVRATDPAGNTDHTPARHTWTVDNVAPSGTVLINDGADSTDNLSVILSLSADDPPPSSGQIQMRFREVDETSWSAWESYTTSKPWTFGGDAGTKTIYVQYQDHAGNLSPIVSDTIEYIPAGGTP